jgi:eukaryotic-like serine/threonine-protein kinase
MEPGGIFAKIHGTCPVPKMMKLDGVNDGRGAGRVCWTVMNSGSNSEPFICRNNRSSCFHCAFFQRVQSEKDNEVIVATGENMPENFDSALR